MKFSSSLVWWASVLTLTYGTAVPTATKTSTPVCSNLAAPSVSGATVLSIAATEKRNYTVLANPQLGIPNDIPNLNVCEVLITLAHPDANDTVDVQVWLPLSGWNGRFVAVGGSAWAAGLGEISVGPYAARGFAAATTNAGLSGDPSSPAAWALLPNGSVNAALLENFASRSVRDLAVVGKQITAAYYGHAARFAYWSGCSTGGRQGMVAAQQFPEEFDGILAGAPAIYWTAYVIAELWPQIVMKDVGYFPEVCELDAVVQAAVAACDKLDSVKDQVLNDPFRCRFDPLTAVGSKAICGGVEITVSREAATIVQKIWEGPRTTNNQALWAGLPIGAPMGYLAATTVVNMTRVGSPFFVAKDWIRYFVEGNPNFDTSAVDEMGFRQIFSDSTRKFGSVIDSANPDLSKLQMSGTKLLVWQGLADQVIFPQDTIQYRQEVQKRLGGAKTTDESFRLFLAPGADHCGLGDTPGAIPTDPLSELVKWVENDTPPEFLRAETPAKAPNHFTRKVCRYPLAARYKGYGDPAVAESYRCEM